ncbi:MAG: hypothetical protein FJX54_09390 [Alphaproteobacteria bacterium]|nr:hypothetical protein [Alphaproteobacteria bacterium]
MPRVYPGLYDRYDDATRAVADLRAAGVPYEDISLIGRDPDGRYEPIPAESTPAGTGAKIGTVIGGGAGLLTGLGIMAIPGVGPVVAAGWLVSTIAGAAAGAVAGAATGGIIGALTHHGVSEEHAHVYAEGVRRGGTLVTARGEEALGPMVDPIYRRTGAIDPEERARLYKSGGWERFDPDAPPYSSEEAEAERNRYKRAAE